MDRDLDDTETSGSVVLPSIFQEEIKNMDALSGLTDDQMALLMCFGAFFGCGLIMSLSYYIGTDRGQDEEVRILMENKQGQSEESQRKAA